MYPIAKPGNKILIVNKNDVPFIGKARGLEVICIIQVDFKHTRIYSIIELERPLKFNPWEKITEQRRERCVFAEVTVNLFR